MAWDAGVYAATAALLKVAGFAIFMWLAYTLPVQDYAQFGLLYALQTALGGLALAGIFEVVVGLLKQNKKQQEQGELLAAANTAFLIMAPPSIAFSVVVYFGIVSASSHDPTAVLFVVCSGILTAYSTLQTHVMRLKDENRASLSFSFLSPFVGLTGGALAFWFESTVRSFFIGTSLGLLFSMAALRFYNVGFYAFATCSLAHPILYRVWPFIAIAFLGWLSGYGNSYVVQAFFSPDEVAKFTFLFMLSSVMQLVASSLNQVWSPKLYRIVHMRPFSEVEKMNRKFYRIQGLALGMVGGTVLAFFPATISAVGGKLIAYQAFGGELMMLFMSYVILIPWWHCQNYCLIHGQGRQLMNIMMLTSVVGIVAWLALIWALGPKGIYLGFLLHMFVRAFAIMAHAKKHWEITIAWEGVAAGLLLNVAGFWISTL